MSVGANDRIWLAARASDIAFQAGQLVHQMLVDRGVEAARNAGLTVVTAEHMLSCIDDALLEQLRVQLDDRTERNSREAA